MITYLTQNAIYKNEISHQIASLGQIIAMSKHQFRVERDLARVQEDTFLEGSGLLPGKK